MTKASLLRSSHRLPNPQACSASWEYPATLQASYRRSSLSRRQRVCGPRSRFVGLRFLVRRRRGLVLLGLVLLGLVGRGRRLVFLGFGFHRLIAVEGAE